MKLYSKKEINRGLKEAMARLKAGMKEARRNFKQVVAGGIGLLVAIVAVIVYNSLFGAPGTVVAPEQFTVPISGLEDVGAALKEAGFIRSELGFVLAIQGKEIEPGAYKLSKSMSAWQVAAVLSGESYMKWVVIPEGLRKEEIVDILAKKLEWTDEEKQLWLKETERQKDYQEGVYFPDTYLIPEDESPDKVVSRMKARFETMFEPYAEEAKNQNIRWTTLIKIASIVQREAADASDMPLIAGVLWNRLLNDVRLQVDATVQYARGDAGEGWWAPISVKDKQIDSPYNTYKYAGLPPGPIGNPGEEAIKAVLWPEETDCLYYIHAAREVYCSETYDEHLDNINNYLR